MLAICFTDQYGYLQPLMVKGYAPGTIAIPWGTLSKRVAMAHCAALNANNAANRYQIVPYSKLGVQVTNL